MFQKLPSLFRLYRTDVLLLSFFAFFAGKLLGKSDFSWYFLAQSIFISLFPYNFVYTLNSITDVVEDSANKPWRPLPSGTISRRDAIIWLLFLTFGSIFGTVILFKGIEKLLVFSIPVFGVFYSLPPFIFKKRGLLACFITGLGIAYPLIIAGGKELLPCSLSLLFHALGVTALKDLSDTEGDILAGRKNRVGTAKICAISIFFMTIAAIGFILSDQKIAAILPISSILVLFGHLFFALKSFNKKIYKRIILTTGIASLIAVAVMEFSF